MTKKWFYNEIMDNLNKCENFIVWSDYEDRVISIDKRCFDEEHLEKFRQSIHYSEFEDWLKENDKMSEFLTKMSADKFSDVAIEYKYTAPYRTNSQIKYVSGVIIKEYGDDEIDKKLTNYADNLFSEFIDSKFEKEFDENYEYLIPEGFYTLFKGIDDIEDIIDYYNIEFEEDEED